MLLVDGRRPFTGELVAAQGIDHLEAPLHVQKADYMFTFHEPDGCPHYTERDEIVLGCSLHQHIEDFACLLIEGFHRGQDISVGQGLCLAQNALGAVLVDVEAEDLSAELAVHNDGSGGCS